MKCQFTRCDKPATTSTPFHHCDEHHALHMHNTDWGERHIAGEATTEDHPQATPIAVTAN